jgi:hypothetical protein
MGLVQPLARPLAVPLSQPLARDIGVAFDYLTPVLDLLPAALFDASSVGSVRQGLEGQTDGVVDSPVGVHLSLALMGGISPATFIAAQSDIKSGGSVSTVGAPGTVATYTTSTGAGTVARTDGSNNSGVLIPATAATWYEVDIEKVSGAGSVQLRYTSVGGSFLVTTITTRTKYIVYLPSGSGIYISCGTNAGTAAFQLYSVRAVPGRHAFAATTGVRPTLRSGYNDFDGVDDLLTVKVPATLGTTCTVYYRTQAGAHVWSAGLTIATDYALSATDWRKAAIFTTALDAGQQASVEAWGASTRPFETSAFSTYGLTPNSSAAASANRTAINAALQAYTTVRLPPGGDYYIGDQIIVPTGRTFTTSRDNPAWLRAIDDFGNKAMVINQTLNPATLGARDANITIGPIQLDGRKATNSTATEHAHGFGFRAVAGLTFDSPKVKDAKGDGYYLAGGNGNWHIPCSDVRGVTYSEGVDRQGFTWICCDGFDLEIHSTTAKFLAADSEPNRATETVQNGTARIYSTNDGTGTVASGVLGISNTLTGASTRDCTFILNGVTPNGQGVICRNAVNVTITGTVDNPTLNGIYIVQGGDIASSYTLDLDIISPGQAGVKLDDALDPVVNGAVRVTAPYSALTDITEAYTGDLVVSEV